MKERGRLKVDENLRVPDWPGVWALGDCTLVPDRKTGQYHPPTAQHALREGKTLATNLIASVRGGTLKPFSFSTIGQLAAIGRRTGVANILGFNFSGFIAWWMWRQFISASFRGSRRSFGLRLIGPWFFCSPRIWCSSRRFVHQRSPT
jgi:NADH dehydrogenase